MLRCAITALVLLAALALATPARLDATGASDLMNKAKQVAGSNAVQQAASDLVDKKILSPELFDKVKGFVTVK